MANSPQLETMSVIVGVFYWNEIARHLEVDVNVFDKREQSPLDLPLATAFGGDRRHLFIKKGRKKLVWAVPSVEKIIQCGDKFPKLLWTD